MPPLRFSIPAQPNRKNQSSLFSWRMVWRGVGGGREEGTQAPGMQGPDTRVPCEQPPPQSIRSAHLLSFLCALCPRALESQSQSFRAAIDRPLGRPSLAHTSQALQPKGQRCDLLSLATVALRSGATRTRLRECAASRKDPGPRCACVPNPHTVSPSPEVHGFPS